MGRRIACSRKVLGSESFLFGPDQSDADLAGLKGSRKGDWLGRIRLARWADLPIDKAWRDENILNEQMHGGIY